MAVTADSVVVELIARTDGYTAAVNGAAGATSTAMSRIERSASQAEAQVVRSSGQMANAQRNLGRQISDIGTQLAGGQSPFLILAQQAPQVADALADTGGRAARVASFFAGPWGAALLAAGSIVGVLVEKLFSLKTAHDEVKKAADASAEAERLLQGVLGGTVDQTEKARIASLSRAQALTLKARAALNNAQAQLTLARSYAAAAAATERTGQAGLGIPGRGAASTAVVARQRQTAFENAQTSLNAAELRLRNLERAANAARSIEADKEAAKSSREAAAASRKAAAARRREEAAANRAQNEAERQAREQAQYTAQRLRGAAELMTAEADLTSDTRLQDEALRARIKAERDAAKAQIDADPDRTASQREELKGYEDRIANARLRLVNINESQRFLDETLALQKADIANQTDALNAASQLAETNGERRDVAVRLLDLAFERERLELEAVLASKKTTETEKAIAQKRLDQLGGLYGGERAAVDRQFEGPGQRYQRQVEAAGRDVGALIDGAAVDGLEALNDQLTDAILNSKSLGDTFSNVARQIVADLLRIAIQQAVIKPLANSLFGGGAGGAAGAVGGFLSGIFGRASGGYVGPGQVVRVNEQRPGVELLRMGPQGGTVIPLGQTTAVSKPAAAAPAVIQLVVGKGQMFEPIVRSISGQVSVQTVASAAPGLARAGAVQGVELMQKQQRFGTR